jgi:hypothetical protein
MRLKMLALEPTGRSSVPSGLGCAHGGFLGGGLLRGPTLEDIRMPALMASPQGRHLTAPLLRVTKFSGV